MSDIYFYIVVILFVLAISDLIVGVSNDAVNFLNSAIGSKVAPYKIIMLVAALGVLIGATFSNGMMEVARKSIFNPDKFYFNEIMIIFLAVMLTDVILLDLFNTFGLPTSTTVSVVFELLGAAVGMAVIKASHSDGAVSVADFINTSTAMKIIFGILLSVVVAFTAGIIVQAISRLLFAFNYEKSYKYVGALFGGAAISAITYFMIIKGAKGTTFISDTNLDWIKNNTGKILLYSFLGWSFILQLMIWIFRTNILKIIVLVGTFSLAMAFAGNDLVNFIGVPLAGFESFSQFRASGATDPNGFLMDGLMKKIPTPIEFLLIAGIIMVATLWLSKKAKSVTQTSLDLSRQDEGDERFGSSLFARVLVREGIRFGNSVSKIVPKPIAAAINSRFDKSKVKKKKDKTSFDLVRASVNLIVAAVLIAIGTSNKLPLSTTYVTFMVAMGSSLADGAWSRESAVYRITGVFTVIGGWFFTAFAAFTSAFIIANIIHWGGIAAIAAFAILAVFLIIKTHTIHKKNVKEAAEAAKEEELDINVENLYIKCKNETSNFLKYSSNYIYDINNALIKDKRRPLVKLKDEISQSEKKLKKRKKKAHRNVFLLNETDLEFGYYYISVLDALEQAFNNVRLIMNMVYEYVDNNHSPLPSLIKNDIIELNESIRSYSDKLKKQSLKSSKDTDNVKKEKEHLLEDIEKLQRNIIKQIKKTHISSKTSLMLQGMLTELKQYINNSYNIINIKN